MTDSKEWVNTKWLEGARNIVEWANQKHSNECLMILLRHSERDVIENHSLQYSTGLTNLGKQMSFEMGKRLPTDKPIRIFYSFVSRCYQTAEELAKGFGENGGEILEFETAPILVMPEYSDETVWDNLQPDGKNVTEFVNRWADDKFGDKIEPFKFYKIKLLKHTFGRLMEEKIPVMHVHVTHDLALMAIKRILLERPIKYEDRESFQGGICCSINNIGSCRLFNSRDEIRLSLSKYKFTNKKP